MPRVTSELGWTSYKCFNYHFFVKMLLWNMQDRQRGNLWIRIRKLHIKFKLERVRLDLLSTSVRLNSETLKRKHFCSKMPRATVHCPSPTGHFCSEMPCTSTQTFTGDQNSLSLSQKNGFLSLQGQTADNNFASASITVAAMAAQSFRNCLQEQHSMWQCLLEHARADSCGYEHRYLSESVSVWAQIHRRDCPGTRFLRYCLSIV